MLPQVGGLSEGFVTHRAGVRLEAKVDILVAPQTARVLEGLGTSVTGVRTLSGVLPQVVLVMRTPFKGQGAIGAQEGTHSSVDTLMDLDSDKERDVKLISETEASPMNFRTLATHLEQRGAFEGFTTVQTFVWLLPRVRPAKEK